MDTNVVHGVVYDRRHDRFWTTQDGGLGDDRGVRTGVTTIEVDGTGFREFKLSHEDNEFIAIEPEGRYVFAGGFNGKIGVFDNTERDFRLERVIGPLDFQVISAAVASRDRIYALLQTGDILRLNGSGVEEMRTRFANRCVWTLEPHPADESLLYAGTDQGVALLRYGPGRFDSVKIEQVGRFARSSASSRTSGRSRTARTWVSRGRATSSAPRPTARRRGAEGRGRPARDGPQPGLHPVPRLLGRRDGDGARREDG